MLLFCWYPSHQALLTLVFFWLRLLYDQESSTAWPASLLTCCRQLLFYLYFLFCSLRGVNSISKERRVKVLFSQAAVAHLLSACPTKGQEGSSSWREIKGSEPDGGAGLWRAAAQRCSAPFLCLLYSKPLPWAEEYVPDYWAFTVGHTRNGSHL